ncbi:MAG: translation initiation factor IF-2, partial [Desulfobacteraceae bacterium]
KRVKPTVIRRRRKKVSSEAEAKAEPGLEEKQEEAPAEEYEKAVSPKPEKEKERIEQAQPPVEAQKMTPAEGLEQEVMQESERAEEKVKPEPKKEKVSVEQETLQKKKAKPKKGKKKGLEEPAKIIKMAQEGPLKDIAKKQKEEEAKEQIEEAHAPAPVEPVPVEVAPPPVPTDEEAEREARKKKEKKKAGKKSALKQRKVEVFEREDLYSKKAPTRKAKKGSRKGKETAKQFKHTEITVPKAIKRRIKVPERVTVGELARAMGVKVAEVIRKLMSEGVVANINQDLDFNTAALMADEFGYELDLDVREVEELVAEPEDRPEDLRPRPPVVTIMGHVDHGKTSLLDYIRSSNIIGGESGGITQHIGAYYVSTPSGDVVFLDTPGHEAFTAMRARGAKVTDIIVLVVAADDGVMPQTKEAVNHARAADIPIIVAINKMDKPEADPERVKRELAELGLVPEDWSGDTLFTQVSAKTGQGVDELLELLSLQSEMLELKANPDRSARGTIIEAKLDKSRGSVATVLIKNGTLRQGDFFICGENYGRVRAMVNNRGRRIDTAGPSMPVEIYGISGVPMAGDDFIVLKDEKTAKQVAEYRQNQSKVKGPEKRGIVSLDDLFDRIKEGDVKELNIILKADVQGSIEAISDSLVKLSTDEVKLKIIHSSTGAVTETDVMLASASGAIIIAFNVRATPRVTEVAEREQVDIRYYDVIYNLIRDIKAAMSGLLEPVYKENVIGRVDIKETFNVPKVGTIAGCQVTDGHVVRNARARLLRDNVVIHDGKIGSLKRFKEDVKEVQSGYECGIGLEGFQDIKPGDVFEVYELEKVQPEL